jgi:hypothetical protein
MTPSQCPQAEDALYRLLWINGGPSGPCIDNSIDDAERKKSIAGCVQAASGQGTKASCAAGPAACMHSEYVASKAARM